MDKTVILLIIMFLLGMLVGVNCSKQKPEVITKVEYVKGDTVVVTKTNKVIVEKIKPIYIKENKITSKLDTTLVSNLDTIGIKAEVSIDSIANWLLDIDHRDYQIVRVDTVKFPIMEQIFIEKERMFYEEPYFNLGLGLLVAIILQLL